MLRNEEMKVAVVQMCSTIDKRRNLTQASDLIAQAVDAGAQLVVLPELFNCLGSFSDIIAGAETKDGPTVQFLRQTAQKHAIHLCGGSICEMSETPGKGFNSMFFFNPRGDCLGVYRKIHLFEIDLPDRVSLCESDIMCAGNEPLVVECDLGRIGFATCYDLRFPELFRDLIQKGAEIICFPSAFTKVTGQDHWHTLLQARAIENQCFLVAANQVGNHTPRLESYGHSLVVDPWGKILVDAKTDHTAIVATIKLEKLDEIRHHLPALTHRKSFLNRSV